MVNVQAIGVHGLAGVELQVLEHGEELVLDVGRGALLKGGDFLGGLASLLHGSLDGLHVALEVDEVALLVERGALETERVDNVVDLDIGVLESLLGLLSGSVGTSVYQGRGMLATVIRLVVDPHVATLFCFFCLQLPVPLCV